MTKSNGRVKYKKPPQAPRRFKSSYMFFSTEKHREIRDKLEKEGETVKTTHIAKLVSVEWKKLTPQEREVWEEKAKQDKARYEMEKSLYTGPWKVPAKRRAPKDPNAPKRPMSAFLAFSHSRRAKVRAENPKISNVEVSRVLAKMWKEAPDEERRKHIEEELRLRKEYKVAITAWRSKNEEKMAAQRMAREEEARQRVRVAESPYEVTPDRHSSPVDEASSPSRPYYSTQGAPQLLPPQEGTPPSFQPAVDPNYASSPYAYGTSSSYPTYDYGYSSSSYPSYQQQASSPYCDPWAARMPTASAEPPPAAAAYIPEDDSVAAYEAAYNQAYVAGSYQQDPYASQYGAPYDSTAAAGYDPSAYASNSPYGSYYGAAAPQETAQQPESAWGYSQSPGYYPPSY